VIPHGEAARAAWRQLGRGIRRETLLLAIRGRPHPDPTVAALATRMALHIRHLPWRGWIVGVATSAVLWPLSVWLLRLTSPRHHPLLDRLLGGVPEQAVVGATLGLCSVLIQLWLWRHVEAANRPPSDRPALR
jgi:hypothetical protein